MASCYPPWVWRQQVPYLGIWLPQDETDACRLCGEVWAVVQGSLAFGLYNLAGVSSMGEELCLWKITIGEAQHTFALQSKPVPHIFPKNQF